MALIRRHGGLFPPLSHVASSAAPMRSLLFPAMQRAFRKGRELPDQWGGERCLRAPVSSQITPIIPEDIGFDVPSFFENQES